MFKHLALVGLLMLGACQTGVGNDHPTARAAGARTEWKATYIGIDITNSSYQTPAGSCPWYEGTSRYERACWPAPGGNVIFMPLEWPYYDSLPPQPPGAVTVVAKISGNGPMPPSPPWAGQVPLPPSAPGPAPVPAWR